MQAVIPMVFILGFPRETFPAAVRIELLLAGGGVAYIAFALLATVFTDASARRLVDERIDPRILDLHARGRGRF